MVTKLILTDQNASPAEEEANPVEYSFEEAMTLLASNNVSVLLLDGQEVEGDNLMLLAQAITQATELKRVEVGNMGNRPDDVTSLCRILQSAPALEELEAIRSFGNKETHAALSGLVGMHPTLSKLEISYNVLHLDGTQAVTSPLAHNGGLRELDISFNAMDVAGVDVLAGALESNKGLVSVNINTTYNIENSIPNIERMLNSNVNLIECKGISSDVIEARLQENRVQSEALVNALMDDPNSLNAQQREDINARMALVTHLLKEEKNLSHEEIMGKLKSLMSSGKDAGVDPFPAMMAVLPFREMLNLAAQNGHPLKSSDFFHPTEGATPLMQAAIDRGVGAQLFSMDGMEWKSDAQLAHAHDMLPDEQKAQVTNLHRLRAKVRAETNVGVTRSMTG